MSQMFKTVDVARLQIDQPPADSDWSNLIRNANGELGGWQWETPVDDTTLEGAIYNGAQVLKYLGSNFTNSGLSYFQTELVAISDTDSVAPYVRLVNTNAPYVQERILWYDANQNLIHSDDYGIQQTGDNMHLYDFTLYSPARAGAAFTRLVIEFYADDAGGTNYSLPVVAYFDLATIAWSSALQAFGPGYVPPFNWLDILNPATDIRVEREELNVGTLTAIVRDSDLDPSQADKIRPGRRVQLVALVNGIWEPLFVGDVSTAKVTYDLLHPDEKQRARIELTATDDITLLAQARRPDGVPIGSQLPWVLEGAGVPWNVDGYGGHLKTAPDLVSKNENNTALDQVAITRDSELGHAWMSRAGVLTYESPSHLTTLPKRAGKNLIYGGSFEAPASIIGPRNATYTVIREQGEAADGGWYLTGPASGGFAGDIVMAARTRIPITGGATYTISWYARESATSESGDFWFNIFDADGVRIGQIGNDNDMVFTSFGPGGSGGASVWPITGLDLSDWQRVGMTFTAPAGAVECDFYGNFYGTSSEPYKLDAFQLEQGASATNYEEFVVADTLHEGVYNTDLDIDFDTERTINSVTVDLLRFNDGQTEEVTYGPYEDAASVRKWRRRAATFRVHGIFETETPGGVTVDEYAEAILLANATPRVRINSVIVPFSHDVDLSILDLGQIIGVSNAPAGISEPMRIASVEHHIRPNKWLMRIGFTHDGGVASPRLVPPLNTGEPIGGPVRIGDIVMSGRTDESFGFVKANGQLLNTADYPALFDQYGYTYGGSGSQFAVPDMTDLFPIGAGNKALGTSGGSPTVTLSGANLPPHRHDNSHDHSDASLKVESTTNTTATGSATRVTDVGDTTGGGGSNTFPSIDIPAHSGQTGDGSAQGLAADPVNILNPWRALNFFVKARA